MPNKYLALSTVVSLLPAPAPYANFATSFLKGARVVTEVAVKLSEPKTASLERIDRLVDSVDIPRSSEKGFVELSVKAEAENGDLLVEEQMRQWISAPLDRSERHLIQPSFDYDQSDHGTLTFRTTVTRYTIEDPDILAVSERLPPPTARTLIEDMLAKTLPEFGFLSPSPFQLDSLGPEELYLWTAFIQVARLGVGPAARVVREGLEAMRVGSSDDFFEFIDENTLYILLFERWDDAQTLRRWLSIFDKVAEARQARPNVPFAVTVFEILHDPTTPKELADHYNALTSYRRLITSDKPIP